MTLMRRRKCNSIDVVASQTNSRTKLTLLSPLKDHTQKQQNNDDNEKETSTSTSAYKPATISKRDNDVAYSTKKPIQSFLMAKFFILRFLGFVYFTAFVGAYYQNRGLLGTNGLNPASTYMDQLRATSSGKWDGFLSHPTLFWLMDGPIRDEHLDMISVAGIGLSLFVALGLDSWLVMAFLWVLDFSIVTVAGGSSFYQYGWESQLLETGFLAIFLCDLPHFVISTTTGDKRTWRLQGLWCDSTVTFSSSSPPSLFTLWLFRWLCFRISIGAGLIKLRGSSCWQDKTCLYYHFETQPIPSPFSFFFHFLPNDILKMAVDLDYFVQLYTIWLVLVPGCTVWMIWLRRLGGFMQAGFMVNIILSGNFAFLNHLTIIPALACLDDNSWPLSLRNLVIKEGRRYSSRAARTKTISYKTPKSVKAVRIGLDICLVVLIATLSSPVITNLLQWGEGRTQQMNASFNAFRLVNTYGAFGSVGEARYEPIVSISHDGHTWHELEFPCKPGRVTRRPCFCAPYHYRLDWNIWFLGFKPHKAMLQRREQWVIVLLAKILESNGSQLDRPWLELLDTSSAKHFLTTPKYAKVDMFRYKMAAPLWVLMKEGWYQMMNKGSDAVEVVWWQRYFEEVLVEPVSFHSETKNLVYANIPGI